MQWSITIGRIAGTSIRIHVTFLLFLFWIGISDYAAGGLPAAWASLTFIVLIFACVTAHEFGHILTARCFGVHTPEVVLLPIGGVASMERIPEEPRQEFLVAIAGPMVNVVIAAGLLFFLGQSLSSLGTIDLEKATLLQRLALTNIVLAVFNLVPAFPMDGGRVLRSLLAMRLGLHRATEIAAKLGQVFAFLFVIAGLFSNPMLIFIGLFIYIGASAERQGSALHWFSRDLKVSQAMEKSVRSFPKTALLSEVVSELLTTSQRNFAVIDEHENPVGFLDREDLVNGLINQQSNAAIASIMREPSVTHEDDPLEKAISDMTRQGRKSKIVINSAGRVVGILTFENVIEMLMIHNARPDWHFPETVSHTHQSLKKPF